ncbi:hypothetical protein [Marinobacter sp. SS21]|uniref:hypothetical protein n=1 Tax=Marinobacter sp. SS21 TaxID=2979460 RepID=UPI00232DAD5C|nr:hypothetical protein [Marinobacter sp. SS21]MDC0661339.1 hypothetical protein [Marinobacter sp. SS21]
MRYFSRIPCLPTVLALAVSTPAMADDIDVLMADLFPKSEATYIGYDRVERMDIPETAPVDRRYLIVDFRFHNPLALDRLQTTVHKVCMAMLEDQELMRSLSTDGYDMVAVAFDRQSQYDCL